MPEIEPKQVDTTVVQHKLNDDVQSERSNNTLLISANRSHQFYERAARELLASGHDEIKLSALGEAMVVAVKLSAVLEEKHAANVLKIETVMPPARDRARRGYRSSPGILITMKKDEAFKGTKITPGYISFCLPTMPVPAFTDDTASITACIFSGYDSSMSALPANMASFLEGSSLNKDELLKIYKSTIETGAPPADSKYSLISPEVTDQSEFEKTYARLCRNGDKSTGSVFLTVLSEDKRPFKNSFNYAIGLVVFPRKEDYPSAEEYSEAMETASTNLMSALCDYNGVAKRGRSSAIRRIATARIEAPDCSPEAATSFLTGMNTGYHYGPAPRLNFVEKQSGCIQTAWIDMSGIPENLLNFGNGSNPNPTTFSGRNNKMSEKRNSVRNNTPPTKPSE